ncbi:23397_t:CDS:2, partial [Dentiscutata erythropus]
YPYGVYIPSNFTIPAGNVFKFKLYSGGYFWFKCNRTSGNWDIDQVRNVYFNHEEDLFHYPYLAVALLDFRGISAIPKYDDSTMIVTVIGTAPSLNPRENRDSEIIFVNSTAGNGAFSDVTYLIFTDVKGGLAPPSKECGTIYPDGYIYSETFTATLLYYHAKPE